MGRRAAREKKREEVDITFVCTAHKDSFAYLSKYLNLDFLIEVVVIGLSLKARTICIHLGLQHINATNSLSLMVRYMDDLQSNPTKPNKTKYLSHL
jgi:hypothetical protein